MIEQPQQREPKQADRLKVWLINPYVNLPGEQWRLGRSALLAYELAKRGHDVLLWTGGISHRSKSVRTTVETTTEVVNGFKIRLIPSVQYKKNIGLDRLAYEAVLARKIYKKALQESAPDIIVAHDPPQVFGHCGYLLSKKFNVPLITDTVDLWPEFWVLAFPNSVRWAAKAAFAPFFWWRRRNWRHASGYTSLAKPYLDLVQREVDPEGKKPTAVAYNGIDLDEFRGGLRQDAQKPKEGSCRAVFAGTLGPSYDLPAIVEAAKIAENRKLEIEFVIAGDGPLRPWIESECAQCSKLTYVGKLAPSGLAELYSGCNAGLCSYSRSSNVEMPDKVYDYTGAGLVVLNSLTGEVKDYIAEHGIGFQYEAGSGESLIEAITRAFSNPEEAQRIADRSYQCASDFDNSVQIGKYANLVETVACKVH